MESSYRGQADGAIIITGNGQVARALGDALKAENTPNVHILAREDMDVTNAEGVKRMFGYIQPKVVFHAAALTKVDYCERNPEEAMLVNATGTENVVAQAKKYGAKVIYFSTDYVFPGKDEGEYTEDEEPNPINMYGKSKLAGEFYVSEYENGIIIRTAQVFAPIGRNFPAAIREKLSAGEQVQVVSDEIATPTYAPHLAEAIVKLLPKADRRIYHIRGPSVLSYYEWALSLALAANLPPENIHPISAKALKRDAPRPLRAVLSMKRYLETSLPPLPPLEHALNTFISKASEPSSTARHTPP